MKGLVGDVRGLDEEIIGLAGEALARPGNVDYRVDDEIGDMDAERPEFAREGFGEDALRRLGRREPGKSRAAAFGLRIAGDEARAALRLLPPAAPARHLIERHHRDGGRYEDARGWKAVVRIVKLRCTPTR